MGFTFLFFIFFNFCFQDLFTFQNPNYIFLSIRHSEKGLNSVGLNFQTKKRLNFVLVSNKGEYYSTEEAQVQARTRLLKRKLKVEIRC